MNHIFIITNNNKRLYSFIKYYNVYNKPTDTKLHVIIDDRNNESYDIEFIKQHFELHKISDVIKKVKPLLNNENIIEKIIEIYGVSIKLLIFPYIHKILNIPKAMMMDDDTFLLSPLDHWFKLDYVYYNESALGALGKNVKDILYPLYKDLIDVHQLNDKGWFSINSGQIIHTENNMYINFISKFFTQTVYDFLVKETDDYKRKHYEIFSNTLEDFLDEPVKKKQLKHKNKKVGSKVWIMEQNIYAIYYKWLSENNYTITKFNGDVRIWTTIMKEDTNIKKLPNFIHYLPADKEVFYKIFPPLIDKILNGENNVLKQK